MSANAKWTDKEVKYLNKNWDLPVAVVAKTLGRTVSSVASKKYDLREKGEAPETGVAKRAAGQETSKPAKVENNYTERPWISAAEALAKAASSGKNPFLIMRGNKAIYFLENGQEDLDRAEHGELRNGDVIFELRRKYVVGPKLA